MEALRNYHPDELALAEESDDHGEIKDHGRGQSGVGLVDGGFLPCADSHQQTYPLTCSASGRSGMFGKDFDPKLWQVYLIPTTRHTYSARVSQPSPLGIPAHLPASPSTITRGKITVISHLSP